MKRSMLLPAIAGCLLAVPAFAAPVTLDVTNGSARELTELHVAPAGSDAAEELLGGAFLPAGNTASFSFGDDADGCTYDVTFVFATGDAAEETGRDLCADSAVTVTD